MRFYQCRWCTWAHPYLTPSESRHSLLDLPGSTCLRRRYAHCLELGSLNSLQHWCTALGLSLEPVAALAGDTAGSRRYSHSWTRRRSAPVPLSPTSKSSSSGTAVEQPWDFLHSDTSIEGCQTTTGTVNSGWTARQELFELTAPC